MRKTHRDILLFQPAVFTLRTVYKHLRKDQVMAELLRRVGPFRMQYREPSFETLVRSIVYQQLSGKVASVIFARLHAAAGEEVLTPAGILKLRTERMRKLGLSGRKTLYIRELAKHTKKGKVVFENLHNLEDLLVVQHLTQVKGIGVWTAQMFLMFALKRPDVLPVADLSIRQAIRKSYNLPDLPGPPEMEAIAAVWRPYRSFACWYLWRSLEL